MEIYTINLELGRPDVQSALKHAEFSIASVRAQGGRLIKFIHGYGSSGKGGKIRTQVRKMLNSYKQKGRVSVCVYGENFSIFDAGTRYLLDRYPSLAKDPDLNRGNMGITFVYL
ncbi:MAG: hypothetical protein GX303_08140 [Clostridiales bacterium]|nr:hypothetical protein [Clostridiales bacterium]